MDADPPAGRRWTIELWQEPGTGATPFERWLRRTDPYVQAVVDATLTHIVEPYGIALLATEWCTALGDGLYEIRVRRSLHAIQTHGSTERVTTSSRSPNRRSVLLRLFVTFHGQRVVLLLHGYDKGKDPSQRRQRREIARARRCLATWRRTG